MIFNEDLKEFYKNKKVLITGIHGFKGAWLAQTMIALGAKVYGYGLAKYSSDENSDLLYRILRLKDITITLEGDITDFEKFKNFFEKAKPDIVFHLAAQPLVSLGYEDPLLTYSSNVMGTASVLNAIRSTKKKVSVISVTTDKVYKNLEKAEGYLENDELNGADPYSNSKSCAELVSYSFNQSYFLPTLTTSAPIIMSTVRAGNVIGGGDFSENRIIPDIARAIKNVELLKVRNINAIRPYQHVLDAVVSYAIIAMKQYSDSSYSSEYNIGPNKETVLTTKSLLDFFVFAVDDTQFDLSYEVIDQPFHETSVLLLNSDKFRETFSWAPVWGSRMEMLSHTYSWYYEWVNDGSYEELRMKTIEQIGKFLND